MMDFTRVNWPLVGIFIGGFWGAFAFFVYTPHPLPWKKKKNYPTPPTFWRIALDVGWSIVVPLFQFFFNFIGGFAGCIAFGLFFERYSHSHLGVPEFILIVFGLLGVSGKLSEIIYQIPGYIKKLMDTLAAIALEKLQKP